MAAAARLRDADGTMAVPMIETEVVLRARRGDQAAFAQIVELYQRPIFNYVLRMLGDREVAEEVTQDVFLRVHQNLQRFSFRAKFTTWLFRIAKNRALDELRSDPRRQFRAELEEDTIAVDDAPVEQAETIDAIWRADRGSACRAEDVPPPARRRRILVRGDHGDRGRVAADRQMADLPRPRARRAERRCRQVERTASPKRCSAYRAVTLGG